MRRNKTKKRFFDRQFVYNAPEDGSGGSAGPTPKDQAEALLAQRLEQLTVATNSNNALQQIATNPLVQQVLLAQQNGKRVKIVDDVEEVPAIQPSRPIKDMDNEELVNYLQQLNGQNLSKTVPSTVQKMIEQHTAPLLEQIKQLRGLSAQSAEEKMTQKIDAAKSKYSDFDKYTDQMISLAQRSPGLEPEDYYFLVKRKNGSPIEPTKSFESERPTHSVTKPPISSLYKDGKVPSGAAGFADILRKSAERMDVSGLPTH